VTCISAQNSPVCNFLLAYMGRKMDIIIFVSLVVAVFAAIVFIMLFVKRGKATSKWATI